MNTWFIGGIYYGAGDKLLPITKANILSSTAQRVLLAPGIQENQLLSGKALSTSSKSHITRIIRLPCPTIHQNIAPTLTICHSRLCVTYWQVLFAHLVGGKGLCDPFPCTGGLLGMNMVTKCGRIHLGFRWFISRCSVYIHYPNISLISTDVFFWPIYTFESFLWHMLNTCSLEKKTATQGTLPRTTETVVPPCCRVGTSHGPGPWGISFTNEHS